MLDIYPKHTEKEYKKDKWEFLSMERAFENKDLYLLIALDYLL